MANGPNIKVYVGCEQMRQDANMEAQWNDANGEAKLLADESGVTLMSSEQSSEKECLNPSFVFVDNSGASPAIHCGSAAQKLFANRCSPSTPAEEAKTTGSGKSGSTPARFGSDNSHFVTFTTSDDSKTKGCNIEIKVGNDRHKITQYRLEETANGNGILMFVMDGENYHCLIPNFNGENATISMRFANDGSLIIAQVRGAPAGEKDIYIVKGERESDGLREEKPKNEKVFDAPREAAPKASPLHTILDEIRTISEELKKYGFPEYSESFDKLQDKALDASDQKRTAASLEKYRAELAEFRDVFARLDEIKTIADELAALGDPDYKNEFPKIAASVRKKVDENNADIAKILAKITSYLGELIEYRDELRAKRPHAAPQKAPETLPRAEVKKETPEVPKAKVTPKNATEAIAVIQKIDGYKNVAEELKKIGKTFGELEKLGIKETDKKYLYLCARIFDAAEQGAKPADVLGSLQNYHAELKKIKIGLEDKQRAADEAAKKAQVAAKEKPVDKKPEETKPEAVKTKIPPATQKKVEKKETAGVTFDGIEEVEVPPAKAGDEQKAPLGKLPERERKAVAKDEPADSVQGDSSFTMGTFPVENSNEKQIKAVERFSLLAKEKGQQVDVKDRLKHYDKMISACEEVIKTSKVKEVKEHYIEVKKELTKEKATLIAEEKNRVADEAKRAKEEAKAAKEAELAAKKAAKDAEVAAKKAAELEKKEKAEAAKAAEAKAKEEAAAKAASDAAAKKAAEEAAKKAATDVEVDLNTADIGVAPSLQATKKIDFEGDSIKMAFFSASETSALKAQLQASQTKFKYLIGSPDALAKIKGATAGIKGVVLVEKPDAKDNSVYLVESNKSYSDGKTFGKLADIALQYKNARGGLDSERSPAARSPRLTPADMTGFQLTSEYFNSGGTGVMEFNPFDSNGNLTEAGKKTFKQILDRIQEKTKGNVDLRVYVYRDIGDDIKKELGALNKAVPDEYNGEVFDDKKLICGAGGLEGGFPIVINGKYTGKKRVYIVVGHKADTHMSLEEKERNDRTAIQQLHTKLYFRK